jgi:hypothetical protein
MEEKPPKEIGQGLIASRYQVSAAYSFSPTWSFQEVVSLSVLLAFCATLSRHQVEKVFTTLVSSMTSSPPACPFIVIHLLTTTGTTDANTYKITSFHPTMAKTITNMTNSPAHLVTVTSFNTATVAKSSTLVNKATAFTSAPTTAVKSLTSPRLFIVARFAPSHDITTADTKADDAITLPVHLAAANITTAATDASTTTAHQLYTIYPAATRVSTAADDASIQFATLLLLQLLPPQLVWHLPST